MVDIEKKEKNEEQNAVPLEENKTEKNVKENNNKSENDQKEEIKIESLEKAKSEEIIAYEKDGNKNKIIIAIIIVILILLVVFFSTIFAIINVRSDKIIKGVTIGKIDASNLTKEEAKTKLIEIYNSREENKIYFTHGEFEGTVTYKSIEVQYLIDKAVNQAYEIGRSRNVFKDNIDILTTWKNGKKIKVEAKYDEEIVKQISKNINNNVPDAVIQSSYYIDKENLVVTSGKQGVVVDEPKLTEEINKIINSENEEEAKIDIPMNLTQPDAIDIDKIHQEVYKEVKDAYYIKEPFEIFPESDGVDFNVENAKTMIAEVKEEYTIPLIITKPTKTIKDIGTEAFPDLLATFSTRYVNNKNRTTNLRLAAEKINGTVLLVGDEFSYNKVVGERTIQAGYKQAATFSNGMVVDGLGGGICQISSTLYDAVVMANLEVTERRNHQFVTSYLPAGKDATVVYGSQDFKFKNTRKYPIRITATVEGGVATISVWGIKEEIEYDISIETQKTATISYTTQYIQDSSLAAGKQVVKQSGHNGSKVDSYKVMRLNGEVISRTLLSKDTYNAMKRIVRVGTGG